MNQSVAVIVSILVLSANMMAQTVGGASPAQQRTIVIQPPTIPTPIPPAQTTPIRATTQNRGLAFDADSKEYSPKPGELSAPFVFNITNVSDAEIIITNVTTSCGCTVAQLPSQPWHLAPGANGEIKATMNLVGKMGRVTKQLTVNSSVGIKALLVNVTMPPLPTVSAENARGDRNRNMEIAKTDRQAVFKGECRSCHVDKGSGQMGKELYAADCGICHDSNIRAAMVPDLRAPKGPRDLNFWVSWITYGRQGSMMPAFGQKDGGPLSAEQIDSLAKYLLQNFPRGPVPTLTPAIAPTLPKPGAGQ